MNVSGTSLGFIRLLVVAAAAFFGSRGLHVAPAPAPGPVPPQPAPPGPAPPADPLAAKLKAAFDADGGAAADKARAAKDLAELYRQAAALAADPAVGTAAALLERVRAAARTLVRPGLLAGTRSAVAAEVAAVFPADGPLADDGRAAAAALFRRVAAALASV